MEGSGEMIRSDNANRMFIIPSTCELSLVEEYFFLVDYTFVMYQRVKNNTLFS
jgi:hypothetical protein